MSVLSILNYKKKHVKYQLDVYNKPDKVYIPLLNENITVLVKKDDYVFKGSVIAKEKENVRMPVFSSVSGKIINFGEHTICNGKKVKCIVIENDFKEKIEKGFDKVDNLNQLSKQDFLKTLEKNGIVELDETGFPIYQKYDTLEKVHTLIIKTFEYESYISSDYMIIQEKCEEILEAIDAILEINNIDKCIIAIKKKDKKILDILNKYIGTYLKIKIVIVPNSYLCNERKLIKKLTGVNYDKYYIKKDIIVSNVSTIYAIYEALKLNKPMIERIVTFYSANLKDSRNILVKVGTPIKEVIDYMGFNYKNKGAILVNGKIINKEAIKDLIVTPKLSTIIINDDILIKKDGQNKYI